MTSMKQTKLFQGQDLTTKLTMKKAKVTTIVSPGEKSQEKTDESSGKELTKQPAPDPTMDIPTKTIEYKLDWTKDITLRGLESLGRKVSKNYKPEHQILTRWEEKYHDSFDDPAERFDLLSPSTMFGDNQRYTWDEAAEAIFEHCGRDMHDFVQQLELAWDFDRMEILSKDRKKHGWTLRRFTYAIAFRDPTALFHIDEEEKRDGEDNWTFKSTYWDLEKWSNPTLLVRGRPLAMMWMASAEYLGHPWTLGKDSPNVFDKFQDLSAKKKRLRLSKNARRMETRRDVQEKKRARKRDDMSEDEEDMDEGRAKAPVPPKSPDKLGVRFRTDEQDPDNEFQDIAMDDAEDYEEFEDSFEELKEPDAAKTPDGSRVIKNLQEAIAKSGSSKTIGLSKDDPQAHFKIKKFNSSPARKSPDSHDFFAPRGSRSSKSGQPKVLELTPKEIPKPNRKPGVDAKNCTKEEIQDFDHSDNDDANESSDEEFQPDSNDTESSSEESSYPPDEVENDEEGAEEENIKIMSPPEVNRRRGSRKNDSEDDESKNEDDDASESSVDSESRPDPLDGVDTNRRVYRRTSLGLFDALAAEELEDEYKSNDVLAGESEIQVVKVTQPSTQVSQPSPQDSHMEVDTDDDDMKPAARKMLRTKSSTYSEAAAKTPHQKLIPEEVLVKNLIQPKLDGLPVPNHFIFIFVFSFMWNGAAAGMSITKKCINSLHTILEAVLKTPFKFKILPLDEEKCKNQKLWITNSERLKHLMSHWYQVKNYLDMDFGNAEWLTSQSRTTGNKTVRTRMRFAFDDTVEGARATLGGILEEEGGFVRDSPLQIDHIGISGCLPFLPPLMSPEMVAHALMKEMGFRFALALIWDWVSSPSNGKGGSNRNKKNPSLQLWNVVTALKYMPRVDEFMRSFYNPKTPRFRFPWCGISTYFHHWRAASKKWLSVGPYGPVRELAASLILKAIDYNSVTHTFCTPIPIPGMLRKIKTTRYGEISFLRFLYSIKATLAQVESAVTAGSEEGAGENSAEAEGAVRTDVETEEFIEVKNKKAKKPTKDELLRLAAERNGLSEETNARELRAEAVRKQDAGKTTPLKLFSSILPEPTPGYFAVTSRLKVLPLSVNVMDGLAAFTIAHLGEPNQKRAENIVAGWLGRHEVEKMKRLRQHWNQDRQCVEYSSTSDSATQNVENGIDWLEFERDVTDQVQGFLEVDFESADAKDIDDGATVAGAADEMRAKDALIEDMVQEITIREEANDALRSRIAELEMQMAAVAKQTTPPRGEKATVVKPSTEKKQQSRSKKSSKKTAPIEQPLRKKQPDVNEPGGHEPRSRSRRGGGSSAKGPC